MAIQQRQTPPPQQQQHFDEQNINKFNKSHKIYKNSNWKICVLFWLLFTIFVHNFQQMKCFFGLGKKPLGSMCTIQIWTLVSFFKNKCKQIHFLGHFSVNFEKIKHSMIFQTILSLEWTKLSTVFLSNGNYHRRNLFLWSCDDSSLGMIIIMILI